MSERRSIVLDGKTTSIALEPVFWKELDRFAVQQGIEWQDFTRILLDDMPESANRAASIKEAVLLMVKEEKVKGIKTVSAYWEIEMPHETKIVQTAGPRIFLGRDNANDLIVNDPEISRRHALLVWDNKAWWIVDLESKNGVFLGKKKIVAARLKSDSVFSVGTTKIRKIQFES